ncbi:MAG: MATE family multidrug resistance protein [Polyangiales bacterium]|jgi:MATE family multidrug resistance protein
MVSHALMSLVDTFCVSTLGAGALAGVGLGSISYFVFAGFGFGFFRGSKVLVSQARGAGDEEAIERHAGAALAGALVVGVVITLCVVLIAPALTSLAPSAVAGRAARDYASILGFAGVPAMFYVALREVRYGSGDSTAPMRAALLANAVNIGLDVLFVLIFEWGVEGAAVATVVAYVVQVAALAPAQWGKVRRPCKDDLRALRRMGAPTGIQFVLEIGSFGLITVLLSVTDERQVAAHQVALQLMHFVFLPMAAVSEACSVLAGQAHGAHRRKLIPVVGRLGLRVALIYALVWFVLIVMLRHIIAETFASDDAELQNIVAVLLLVGGAFQLADGLAMVGGAMLRGIGDVRYSALIGVLTAWVFTPPLTYFLGVFLGLGALGAWIGLTVQILAQAVLLWNRLRALTR